MTAPLTRAAVHWPTASDMLAVVWAAADRVDRRRWRETPRLCVNRCEQAIYEWRDVLIEHHAGYLCETLGPAWLQDGKLAWRCDLIDNLAHRYIYDAHSWEVPDEDDDPEQWITFCAWRLAVLRWQFVFGDRDLPVPDVDEAADFIAAQPLAENDNRRKPARPTPVTQASLFD